MIAQAPSNGLIIGVFAAAASPLGWLGFPVEWVFVVPRIGRLEWIVNVPSAHRVHPRKNNRPFVIAYEEFAEMFRDAFRFKRPEILVRPPGWGP